MTKPDPLVRDEVLRRLAGGLEDGVLVRLFPGEDPRTLRSLIAGTPEQISLPVAPPAVALAPTPISGCCRLFTDGASRGNPGQAGAGAVLLGADGEELAARAEYLGVCTNNVAEYRALLLGLDEALMQGCRELAISLDSELIVRQIQGRYKVKNETLLPLFQQVQQRLARLHKWSIAHVLRAQNSRADQLANQGIDDRND